MDRRLPVKNSEDVLAAVAAVSGAAGELRLPEAERSRVLAAAISGAMRAFQAGGSLTLRWAGDSVIDLTLETGAGPAEHLDTLTRAAGDLPDGDTAPHPLQPWEDLSEMLRRAQENGATLVKNRSLISSLESELDETNRGVLALYAELDDRADKLRRADELKSRFLSYASHELRTPLNGIVGLVRLLRSSHTERPEEDLKQLAFIQRAAEEMREMVNDLLDLAKVEAGKVTVQPSEFDLSFVFGALRGIFRPLLQTEDVTLIFEDTSAVPNIYSDEAKVSQILRNLLSNALKFTERGSVRVWAAAEGETVHICVSDTGIGIPPDQLPRIFEEFTQVETPLQRRVRGTGLGLPLCQKFAELLGGALRVESTPGVGSTFTLILPRTYQVPSDRAAAEDVRKVRTRATVLIVDDIEIDRYLLSHLITASGDYDIIQAADGKAGLDAARREHPDLIFLDVNLPLMDGFSVAAMLRQDPSTRQIPIFAVTAEKLSAEDRERLLALTRGILLKESLSDAQRLQIDLTAPAKVHLV